MLLNSLDINKQNMNKMCRILKQVSLLYEKELYSNVVVIMEKLFPLYDQKQEASPLIKFQLHLYYADSKFNLQQYASAENAYKHALQIRKYIIKTKNNGKMLEPSDLPSDVDIRYKMYLCYDKLCQKQKCLDILQSIPAKSRNSKVNMALGNLFHDANSERSAITCYKEVLKENPFALEAGEHLLKLGVKGIEVNSLMLEATTELSWLHSWLKGLAQMHSKEYLNAIDTFKSIDTCGVLNENSNLLVNIAYCYVYMCDPKNALRYLQRAIHIEPNLGAGRDLLATLLAQSQEKEHLCELEKLASNNVDSIQRSCEEWVVLGYSMYVNKKYDRAAYFGHQACIMNRRCVEAFLLKAFTLMQINKYAEALNHFKEARSHSPSRFDAHKGIIECYVSLNRTREAVTLAANSCKQLNNSPQSLTLYATLLMKDPLMEIRLSDLLDKAISTDPTYLPAVWLLAEHLEHNQRHDEAYDMLMKHVEKYPSSRTHQLLADCLVRLQREEEAFTHYSSALRLDPTNQRATEGLNNIGRSLSKLDSNYYLSIGGESSSYASQGPSGPIDVESDSDAWATNADFMTYD